MKLSFRDLKQQKFTIDAEPSDTIGQVKEKIAAEKGWDASSQKLIYSGKILADANTVESYKIEEKGFIVCMVSKPKTAQAPKPATASTPAPATPAPSSSTPAAPAAPQQHVPAARTTAAAAANPPQTPTPAQPAAPAASATESPGFNDPSAMLMGSRNQTVITEMEAMGFPRDEIERALRAAFFNPDRAVDYLLNGIPASVLAEQRPPQQQQQGQRQPAAQQQAAASPAQAATGATGTTRTTETPTAPAPTPGGGDEPVNLFEVAAQAGQGNRGAASSGGTGARAGGLGAGAGAGQAGMNMDFLRSNPQFQQLRQLVQQQPAMLEPILQQLAEGNPQLAQMISQNQEQFLQLLSEDLGDEGVPMPPNTIAVTQEEADAIDRLCLLGFQRDRVIQAYFACDKNEDLAANFLFDQPDEEDS